MILYTTSQKPLGPGDVVVLPLPDFPAVFILWKDKQAAISNSKWRWVAECESLDTRFETDDMVLSTEFKVTGYSENVRKKAPQW